MSLVNSRQYRIMRFVPRICRQYRQFSQGRRKSGAVLKEKENTEVKLQDKTTALNGVVNDADLLEPSGGDKTSETKWKRELKKDISSAKKPTTLVPSVSSTDHLTDQEIHLEGLFAGSKPLFLGKLASMKSMPSFFDNGVLLSKNFRVINASDDGGEKSLDEFLESVKDNDWNIDNGEQKKVIPWQASISGIEYEDKSFSNIPKHVLSKLRPYKLIKLKMPKIVNKQRRASMIKNLKFHNNKVNDELHLVDIFGKPHERDIAKHQLGAASAELDSNMSKEQISAKREHFKELMYYYHRYGFIKSDCDQYKTYVDKQSKLAQKEFQKVTGLVIKPGRSDFCLPLHLYVNKRQNSKILLERYLRKKLYRDVISVMLNFSSNISDQSMIKRFKKKLYNIQEETIRDLTNILPSTEFEALEADCCIMKSPVSGFKRMHWLKYSKRHNVMWGKNYSKEFNVSGNSFALTRSGVRRMKYPVYINWTTYDSTFRAWNHYNM